MKFYIKHLICFFYLSFITSVYSADIVHKSNIDFIHYKAEITPDFITKSIEGTVEITFSPYVDNLDHLSFSVGAKQVNAVYFLAQKIDFSVEGDLFIVQLPAPLKANKAYSVKIEYKVSETRGLKFYDDHLFTVYHTKNWLISHNKLSDKATFDLSIKHDLTTTAIGNGTLVARKKVSGTQLVSRWKQNTPIPFLRKLINIKNTLFCTSMMAHILLRLLLE